MRISYFFIGSVALNVLLILLLFKGCNCNCPDAVVTKHTIDTVRVKVEDVKPSVITHVPVVKKILTPKILVPTLPPLNVSDNSIPLLRDTVINPCNFIVIYNDTTEEADKYRAIIEDTVTGNRITGRKISFFNLTPRIVETIEKTIPLKERVRLYAGVFAGVQGSYSQKQITGWSAGPELAVTFPVGAMVGYGYDARNNGHQLHFLYKIKLIK